MSAPAETPVPGLVPPTNPGGRSGFLADVIIELGLADPDAVDQATDESRMNGATLASVLLHREVLQEQDLARAIAERHGLAAVDLDAFPIDPEAGALVGRATARRYGVLPAGFAPDGSLMLAMADPGDSLARNDVAVMTKLEVTPVIAPRTQIAAALEHLPETHVTTSGPDEAEGETTGGGLLWQADEPGSAQPRPPSRNMVGALGGGDENELERELRAARAELAELRERYERQTAELQACERELRDRDTALRKLAGDPTATRGSAA